LSSGRIFSSRNLRRLASISALAGFASTLTDINFRHGLPLARRLDPLLKGADVAIKSLEGGLASSAGKHVGGTSPTITHMRIDMAVHGVVQARPVGRHVGHRVGLSLSDFATQRRAAISVSKACCCAMRYT